MPAAGGTGAGGVVGFDSTTLLPAPLNVQKPSGGALGGHGAAGAMPDSKSSMIVVGTPTTGGERVNVQLSVRKLTSVPVPITAITALINSPLPPRFVGVGSRMPLPPTRKLLSSKKSASGIETSCHPPPLTAHGPAAPMTQLYWNSSSSGGLIAPSPLSSSCRLISRVYSWPPSGLIQKLKYSVPDASVGFVRPKPP